MTRVNRLTRLRFTGYPCARSQAAIGLLKRLLPTVRFPSASLISTPNLPRVMRLAWSKLELAPWMRLNPPETRLL